MKISTVEQIRNLDKSAIEDYVISQELLMENAGEAVYYVILREHEIKNKKFAVFCGTENNRGGGLAAAGSRCEHESMAFGKTIQDGKEAFKASRCAFAFSR